MGGVETKLEATKPELKAEFDLKWCTEPPIFPLSQDDFDIRAGVFLSLLNRWPETLETGWPSKTSDRWSKHFAKAKEFAESIQKGEFIHAGNYFCEYRITGQPAGLMAVTASPHFGIRVETLFTQVGVVDCGGILIEHAVNMSEKAGKEGIVELAPLPDSIAAYQQLGFVADPNDEDEFLLNPDDQKDKWKRIDGRWRYVKYIGKRYLG